MAKLPARVVKKLWKVPARETLPITVQRRPRSLQVYRNGRDNIKTIQHTVDEDAVYAIENGWVVEITTPRALANSRERAIDDAHAVAEQRVTRRAERSAEPYKTFLAELTTAKGAPASTRVCNVTMKTWPAMNNREAQKWSAKAYAAGASATLFVGFRGTHYYVIAGSPGRLTALLDWNVYGPGNLMAAIDGVHQDVGAWFAWMTAEERFRLCLEGTLTKTALDKHTKALAAALWATPSKSRIEHIRSSLAAGAVEV